MAEKKTTVMVLKADLQCPRCYKKVKRILCKFPQIRDQIYDEKQNTVIFKVVCCCPEKIMQKIRCKGGHTIKSIEILPPPPPPPTKPPKEDPKPEKPPPPAEKPPPPAEKPPPPAEKPPPPAEKPPPPAEKPPPPAEKPKPPPPAEKPKPPPPAPPRTCCAECYGGYSGGPCFHGHGWPPGPPGPPTCYEGYGRPVYDSYGGGRWRATCYESRCDYFSEENPSGCTVM